MADDITDVEAHSSNKNHASLIGEAEDLRRKIAQLEAENDQLKKKQIEIKSAKELYLSIFQNFPALIWRADTNKKCDYFNTPWLEFTGRTLEQELGDGWSEGVHPDDLDRCIEIFVTNFDRHKSFVMDYRLKHLSGEYRWIRDYGQPYFDLDGEFLGYIGACYDITENITNEQRLEALSTTDFLTKVFNRMKLEAILEYEIRRAERYGHALSIMMLDVDYFKKINDDFGHQIGDLVLVTLARLLQEQLRSSDSLGRWGGEEFIIACPETDAQSITDLAEKLRASVQNRHFPTGRTESCSIGVATYHLGDTSNELVQRADMALYHAKNSGRNCISTQMHN